MNFAHAPTPHDVFLNVRRAYRLLYEYQGMVLNAVRYIESQLNMNGYCAYQRFAGSFTDGTQILGRSSWVWLPMATCEFRFWKNLPDSELSVSFLVISDTGFIESEVETCTPEQLPDFTHANESSAKFAFILHSQCWHDKIIPFIENKTQMRKFIKDAILPEDLIKAGVVGKCHDMFCLTSEAEVDNVISDVIALAKEKSWPLERKKSDERFKPHPHPATPTQP